MTSSPLLFAVATFLLQGGWILRAQASDVPAASIRFLVFHAFGGPISSFEVEVQHIATESVTRYSLQALREISLPYGDYTLRISAQGYATFTRRVTIDRPEVLLTAGLQLGSIIPHRESAQASIALSRSWEDAEHTWLRLMDLYAGTTYNADFSATRRVVIKGLTPGRYLALVFVRGELVKTVPLALRDGNTDFVIRRDTNGTSPR